MYPRKYLAHARNYLNGMFHVPGRSPSEITNPGQVLLQISEHANFREKIGGGFGNTEGLQFVFSFLPKNVCESGFGAKNFNCSLHIRSNSVLINYAIIWRHYSAELGIKHIDRTQE